MRLLGRCCVVVGLFVCVLVRPAPAVASTISIDLGTLSTGSNPFNGLFTADNDVALISFSLSADSLVTPEMTAQLCSDPGGCDTTTLGFIPILTLFDSSLTVLAEVTFATGFPIPTLALTAGTYLLAVTQFNNVFSGGGFEWDDPSLTNVTKGLFDPDGVAPCSQFVAYNFELEEPECRSGSFAGSLVVVQEDVPEPATLSLFAVGVGAAVLRRRRQIVRRPSRILPSTLSRP